jgi:hypothetical protein
VSTTVNVSKYINSGKKNNSINLHYYSRPLRSKHELPLEIYSLISIKTQADISAIQISKFAWDGIVDGFEYSSEESFNESLKSGLKESTRRIKQLIANDKNIGELGVDVNFSVLVFSPSGTYVGLLGSMDILLYKNGKIVNISEMLISKQAHTAALIFEDNDLLFTSTYETLTKNINRLIGVPDKQSMNERIKALGKVTPQGEAIVVFESEIKEKGTLKGKFFSKPKKVEQKEPDKVEDPTLEDVPNDLTEPESTDYIPISKEQKTIFKEPKNEKDLRYYLGILGSKLGGIFAFIKRIFKPLAGGIGRLLKNVWIKIKNGIVSIKLSFSEKFARKRWFKRVSAKVSQNNAGKRDQFKGFKVDGYKQTNMRAKRFKTLAIIVLSIILVVVGINFTLKQKEARAIHKSAQEIFTTVGENVESAKNKVNTDRESTEILLFKSNEQLSQLPEGLNEEDLNIKKEFEKEILKLEDTMYKRSGVSESLNNLETYLDTRLGFSEGSNPTDIAIYNDNKNNEYLLVVDSKLKAVFRVSLYNKEIKQLPDNEGVLSDPRKIYVGNSGVYILDFNSGVLRAKFDESGWFGAFEQLSGLSIESLDLDDMSEFAILTDTDNVYILDKASKALYKSSNYGSGYGLSYSYISNDSFDSASDILADLSVYILTKGESGLNRYIYSSAEQKQVPAKIEIVGLNGGFEDLRYGYTRGSLQYGLYLFDFAQKRFMNFEKPVEGGGEILHPNQLVLEHQYIYRGDRDNVWNDIKDFVVDTKEAYMYILDGSYVWKVTL